MKRFVAVALMLAVLLLLLFVTQESKHKRDALGGDPYCIVVDLGATEIGAEMKEQVWVEGNEVHRIVNTDGEKLLLIDHMGACVEANK